MIGRGRVFTKYAKKYQGVFVERTHYFSINSTKGAATSDGVKQWFFGDPTPAGIILAPLSGYGMPSATMQGFVL